MPSSLEYMERATCGRIPSKNDFSLKTLIPKRLTKSRGSRPWLARPLNSTLRSEGFGSAGKRRGAQVGPGCRSRT